MATFEAIYIADISGRLLLDYPCTSTPPNTQELIKKVILSQKTVDNILDIQPVIELSSSRVLYTQTHDTLIILLPCSSTMPVMLPFEFISRFVEILENYLSPPLIPLKIESNYDKITLILNEMVDGGFPYMTYADQMRDMVPYGSLLRKLLSSSTTEVSQVSDIPWRRANVRHTNNELFIDLIETIYCIIPGSNAQHNSSNDHLVSGSAFYSSGSMSTGQGYTGIKPIISRVEGSLFATSNLSGVPEIYLVLNKNGLDIECPSFHPCVDVGLWQNNPGTLQFIPPDGKSLITSYTFENVGGKNSIVFASLKTGLGVDKDEFEARIWTVMSRDIKHVDGLCAEIDCGPGIKSVRNLRITTGEFQLNDKGIGQWRFPGKTPMGWSSSLRGSLRTATDETRPEDEENDHENGNQNHPSFPNHISLSYTLTGAVYSGMKIQTLKIHNTRGGNEGVKPFKGVRYMTNVGKYIVRR